MIIRVLFAIVALSICSTSAFAQDIFWTFGQGSNVSSTSTVDVSDGSGSAYVYVRADFNSGGVDAFDLDFTLDTNNVVQVTNIVLLDAPFPNSNPPENFRWDDPATAEYGVDRDGDGTVDNSEATTGNLFAVGISTNGLNPVFASVGLDPFFDTQEDAFMLARLDYDILSEGVAEFGISLGEEGIVQVLGGGETLVLNPTFGTGTLTVTNVPEPTSAGLLVLGLAGFVARRRR